MKTEKVVNAIWRSTYDKTHSLIRDNSLLEIIHRLDISPHDTLWSFARRGTAENVYQSTSCLPVFFSCFEYFTTVQENKYT
jgi:hypothetical protein